MKEVLTATTPRRGSLRRRWMFTLLVVGAVPLALFGVAAMVVIRAGLEDSEKNHEIAIIDHVVDEIESDLQVAAEATHRVGELVTDARIGNEDVKVDLAREAMARAETLAQVAIYLPDGRLVDAIDRTDQAGIPAPPPVLIDRGDHAGWGEPTYEQNTVQLRYVEPIDRDGQRRAYVVGTLRTGALSSTVGEISRDRFQNRPNGILVIDRNARVVASGETAGPFSVGQSLAHRDILSRAPAQPDRLVMHATVTSTEFTTERGEAMVGTLRTLPMRGWIVAVRAPTSEVFRTFNRVRNTLAIAGLLLGLLALGAGASSAARMTQPLKQLMSLARAYGRREFAVRGSVRSGDEIEELGSTMTEMAVSLGDSEREIERRTRVEAGLSRYLPEKVARSIAAGDREIQLGGERQSVSVLFADVVEFTAFAETSAPEKSVAFLNELFTLLTEIVFRHDGTVDKFMGDCLMAVFGAPDPRPDHAERALKAAEDMHRFVEACSTQWRQRYGCEPRLGIGVNCGEALVGNLGSVSRMEYTAIGDVVNVASRLESLARPGQTLVTSDVAIAAAQSNFEFNALGERALRGRRHAVQILEVVA